MAALATMRDVIVIGGGCYGTFYAGQLARAQEKGRARLRHVIVVDRDPDCRARRELGETADRRFVVSDWSAYFDHFLGHAASGASPAQDSPGAPVSEDYIVPSPLMPHLMFEWVVRRARARWPGRAVTVEPVPGTLGTPYDRSAPAPDHTRYVSFADWICPTHCVEPAICPAIGEARDWEMSAAVAGLATRLRTAGERVAGPALFVCRHHVFGVGTFAVTAVLAGDRTVAGAGAGPEAAAVLVGTISSCHGAVNLLRIGPAAVAPAAPAERRARLELARERFNARAYWAAHEALETVWRSIIREDEAAVWQGLIQAAAALLHRERGNRHGVEVVGRAALEKLAGPQRADVEFETVTFRAELARALAGEADPPRLEFVAHD